jgi:hypothetical protein
MQVSRTLKTSVALILLALLLLSACARPYHSTPFDALTETPGYLRKGDPLTLNSVEILQQKAIAEGVIMLYRWHKSKTGTDELATTFIGREGSGWRAQSSGSIAFSPFDDFVASYMVGGNITNLTTAYGFGRKGSSVRISWSDELVSLVPLQTNGSFVESRPATLQVRRIELLDASGNVLISRDLP